MENIKTENGVTSLEELRQIYESGQHFTAVTINLPRVKSFTMMTSTEQKTFLKRIFADAIKKCNLPYIANYTCTFEPCKDGNIHLHGMFYHKMQSLESNINIIIPGLVTDVVKSIHLMFNRSLKAMKYSDKYLRCSSPICVTQYLNSHDEFIRWMKYIYKQYNH